MPRPTRKPFREAKLRIDAARTGAEPDPQLFGLLAEARAAQSLILASPELSLNQLGKREGRCRTQLARLLRISWLSPKIVEAIAAGTQPKSMTRKLLLISDFSIEWEQQEALFGIVT